MGLLNWLHNKFTSWTLSDTEYQCYQCHKIFKINERFDEIKKVEPEMDFYQMGGLLGFCSDNCYIKCYEDETNNTIKTVR